MWKGCNDGPIVHGYNYSWEGISMYLNKKTSTLVRLLEDNIETRQVLMISNHVGLDAEDKLMLEIYKL